jgi:hypothetical protein
MPQKKSKTDKASLTQELNAVYDAWRADQPAQAEAINDTWIVEVFDNEVVVDQSGTFYKVGYTRTDDEITFADRSEWTEVEKQVEFVEKSARAFIKLTGTNALKTLGRTDDELTAGNYIILFGNILMRDLEGEYFTKSTKVDSPFTKAGVLPVDWDHGHGHEIYGKVGPGKDDVLGVVKWETAQVDEMGVWVERVLDLRNSYMEYIEPLITAGMVGTSSKADGKRDHCA